MLLNLVLAIIFSLRHGEAANENEVEFGQMCVLYDLLSKPIPESKITTREATGTAEAPKKALTNFLSLAHKLNLSVAEPQIVEVLSHLQIYKDKKSVTDDETKKGFFTLADDAELKKLQQLYKEITGTGDADKAFSTKYGAPLSEAQRETIRKPMKQLYDRMLELKRQLDDTAATQETAEKNARKQMTLALYGSDQLSAVGDKLDPRQKLADPAAGQFPWASGARDANCAVASTTKGHAGLALATDMLCICLKHESSTHNQCAGNFIPSAADYAAARSQHDALDAWVKLSKQCPTATDATSLTELQYRLHSATSAVLSSLGSNHQTVAAAQSSSNTDRKKMNFLGYYTLGGAAPSCSGTGGSVTSTQGKGYCIDYSSFRKKDKQIPWVAAVQAAQTHIHKAAGEFAQASTLLHQAQTITNQMEGLLLMASLLPTVKTQIAGTVSDAPKIEEQNQCKNPPNKTAEGCAAIGCEFDSDKNECKPKAEAETTEATGVNCSSHTTKET
uniref:Variant surface glycoprotein 1125.4302 n=1 Tax=Trypanosoma brucei TaxID=5691 RepID=A0A1J0RAS1_9TRYP|nr:variant surface glycoprotein 1125.4302 [Trypanosoma brucei]